MALTIEQVRDVYMPASAPAFLGMLAEYNQVTRSDEQTE